MAKSNEILDELIEFTIKRTIMDNAEMIVINFSKEVGDWMDRLIFKTYRKEIINHELCQYFHVIES